MFVPTLPAFRVRRRWRPLPARQDTAASLGLNVVRTWAFCVGNRPGALQPRASVFDESVFRALDAVVAQAQERNVRLLLALTNNWGDYGARLLPHFSVAKSHLLCFRSPS